MDLQQITSRVAAIVEDTGSFIRSEASQFTAKDVETKSINSLVTYVDKQAETQLIERLSQVLPEAGFYTEEEITARDSREWTWIIDPLDGTTNFIHGIPFYSISVGLQHENDYVMGVVLEISRRELFTAWSGGGAYLNGKPIQVSKTNKLADALIATGFPYHEFSQLETYLETMSYFMKNTRGLRRIGSAALDLAYVAAGRFDAFFVFFLNPWDVSAGIVLIREAGGSVQDFHDTTEYLSGKEVLATNNLLALRMANILKQNFE